MKWLLGLTSLAMISGGGISPASALDYEEYPSIKLRSLDKITARTLTFDAQVGSTIKFGDIFIKIQSCRKPPPVEKNEAAAFLQIWQVDKVAKESRWIFSGWMFSSSPALSGMDHPVYDVWVIDCIGKDPEAMPAPEEKPTDALPDEGTVPEGSVVQPDVAPEEQKADPKQEPKPEAEQAPKDDTSDTASDTEVEQSVTPEPKAETTPETTPAPAEHKGENIDGIY